MIIDVVKTELEAKECDKLLTKLVNSEAKYDNNIKEKYLVNNWFEKIYKQKNNIIFIMKDDEKIIAYAYCKISTSENGPQKNLESILDGLYVEEEYRNKGIATKLIEKSKEWSKNNGVKFIKINVLEKNIDALSIYKKQEFENFERTLRFEL